MHHLDHCINGWHLLFKVLIGQEEDRGTTAHDTSYTPKGQLNVLQQNNMLIALGIMASGDRDDLGRRLSAKRL